MSGWFSYVGVATAPVTEDGKYALPETGIMQPGQYADCSPTFRGIESYEVG